MFQAACPKCSSTNTEFYQERSTGWMGAEGNSVFHCLRCGKRLYGSVAVAEVTRQANDYENNKTAIMALEDAQRLAEQKKREQRHALAEMERKTFSTLKAVSEGAQALAHTVLNAPPPWDPVMRVRATACLRAVANIHQNLDQARKTAIIENLQLFTKDAEDYLAPPPPVLVVPAKVVTGQCAWRECNNPTHNGKMYCSRTCSNKNARWRSVERTRAAKAPPVVVAPVVTVTPKSGNNHPAPTFVNVKCAWCEADLVRRDWQVSRNKSGLSFCSHDHSRAYFNAKTPFRIIPARPKKEAPLRPGEVRVHCAECSKPMVRREYEVKRSKSGRLFCSNEHARAFMSHAEQPHV